MLPGKRKALHDDAVLNVGGGLPPMAMDPSRMFRLIHRNRGKPPPTLNRWCLESGDCL